MLDSVDFGCFVSSRLNASIVMLYKKINLGAHGLAQNSVN